MARTESGTFTTSDGVNLHYLAAGAGPPLVLLPGWSQSAALFQKQLDAFSENYRCLALDYRGHGESAKPDYGYRVSRLAMDLREFLQALELQDVILLGHSAGCAVIWCYLDLFGEAGLKGLVLCDQMIARIRRPEWSEEECRQYGAEVGGDEVLAQAELVGGPEGPAKSAEFLAGMFTESFSEAELLQVIQESLKFPRPYAAELLLSVSAADYRDLLPRISLPALCIGGAASHLGPAAMPWIAAQVPRGELVMIAADAGGSHFMYLENPEAFNSAVKKFCDALELEDR
ncbi:AB hydrolase superfamily protein YdjP [Gimesia panareensis]|uniref:AB hydrolase superfamily protein YdjP n=1 Tax=Gimesia panareensis TaxID=2527978 RepID=A0A517Q6V9_9PLAN|nr:alpha/beta hydrolase [Gimesia panareensis]QDT27343.1 AB hydrolase superfamily protein YdjP [Gimesia panareensis]